MAGNYGAGAGSIERHASASGRNRQKKQVHSLFSRGVMDLTFFLIVMTLLVIGIIMMFSAAMRKRLMSPAVQTELAMLPNRSQWQL